MTGRIIRRSNDLVIVASEWPARNGWESFEKHATCSVIIEYKDIVSKPVVPINGNSEHRMNMKCLNTAMNPYTASLFCMRKSMEFRIIYDYRDIVRQGVLMEDVFDSIAGEYCMDPMSVYTKCE
ncbi:unnamed protein product [Peronospora farinosa]|uniref:Uncharacterized protein n=1 Tax=Peronospora farinosa TaxID=134698 RepID=A0AAV0SWN1_9STRA|nr:unnamed protein product [Peronospora farinosa]